MNHKLFAKIASEFLSDNYDDFLQRVQKSSGDVQVDEAKLQSYIAGIQEAPEENASGSGIPIEAVVVPQRIRAAKAVDVRHLVEDSVLGPVDDSSEICLPKDREEEPISYFSSPLPSAVEGTNHFSKRGREETVSPDDHLKRDWVEATGSRESQDRLGQPKELEDISGSGTASLDNTRQFRTLRPNFQKKEGFYLMDCSDLTNISQDSNFSPKSGGDDGKDYERYISDSSEGREVIIENDKPYQNQAWSKYEGDTTILQINENRNQSYRVLDTERAREVKKKVPHLRTIFKAGEDYSVPKIPQDQARLVLSCGLVKSVGAGYDPNKTKILIADQSLIHLRYTNPGTTKVKFISIKIWAAISSKGTLEPSFLIDSKGEDIELNSRKQHAILCCLIPQATILKLLGGIFIHDNATYHVTFDNIALLEKYFETVISRGGTFPWAPKSPDLNIMDTIFFPFIEKTIAELAKSRKLKNVTRKQLIALIWEACELFTVEHCHDAFRKLIDKAKAMREAAVSNV